MTQGHPHTRDMICWERTLTIARFRLVKTGSEAAMSPMVLAAFRLMPSSLKPSKTWAVKREERQWFLTSKAFEILDADKFQKPK
jgi:hypothetical protein